MKDYKKITNIFVVMIVLNLVAIGLYSYVFYDMKNMTENTTDIRKEVETNTKKHARLIEIEKTISTINDQAKILNNIILDEDRLVDFLGTIEGLADSQGLSIETQIQRNQDQLKEEFSNLSFTLKTQGSWQNTQNFLALIENLPFKVKVNKYSTKVNAVPASESEEEQAPEISWSSDINFDVLTKTQQ